MTITDAVRGRKLPSGLSPSSMELYHQCPRRFEVQKINGGYEPSGRDALLGTFLHRILELVMSEEPEKRTLDYAKVCAAKAWSETQEDDDFKLLNLPESDQLQFRWAGWQSVVNYFGMENPQEVQVESTEEYLSCEVEGVTMRGIIDRVDREDQGIIVADYKNGKVPDPKYRGPKLEQLNFYAVMIETLRGERPTKGRLIFTAHQEILETEFTDKSTEAIVNKVVGTWKAVKSDFDSNRFAPKPGPLCGWCPVLATCPEGMADARQRFLKGRLKQSAPGYSLVSYPRKRS